MKTLEDFLALHATERGEHVALSCGGESITYSALMDRVAVCAASLRTVSAPYVVTRATSSIDFLITYFAAHVAKKVVVPLEKDIPQSRWKDVLSLVARSDIPSEVSDILFTTGTTGGQKGTMISQRAILANAENLIKAQGFTGEHTFIISGPLNHIGSLSKVWPMVVVGGTIVITEGIKDINAFFGALDYPCLKLATFLVPASLRILLQFDEERLHVYRDKMDFIETGAAPMTQGDMERLCKILPNTRLYNTYASTETGIVSTHDYCHDGCMSGCLGYPMVNARIRITENHNIICGGSTIMTGYLGDSELTRRILREGEIYTSDLGYMDDMNRLRLLGRVDDVINVGGFKVHPIEVEDVVMQHAAIKDCICIRSSHPIVGSALKLLYVLNPSVSFDRKCFVAYLKEHLESYKLPILYEQKDSIVRTYNGKLNRKFYEVEK